MSNWPSYGGGAPLTAPVRASCASGNNTKSAWATVISAAAVPYAGILVAYLLAADVTDFLVDFAIGDAGSEQVILNNVLISTPTTYHYAHAHCIELPIIIPAGVRVAFRAASVGGSDYIDTQAQVIPMSSYMSTRGHLFAIEKSVGENAADSGGTQVDPGASADTYGAWVQLSAGETEPVRGIILNIGGQNSTSKATALWYVQIGIGASPGDWLVANAIHLACRIESDIVQPTLSTIIPVVIPTAQAISVRAKCSITGTPARYLDVILHLLK